VAGSHTVAAQLFNLGGSANHATMVHRQEPRASRRLFARQVVHIPKFRDGSTVAKSKRGSAPAPRRSEHLLHQSQTSSNVPPQYFVFSLNLVLCGWLRPLRGRRILLSSLTRRAFRRLCPL
jgi:hypothetical protein